MLTHNRIPWINTVYNKKALNVLSEMANSLVDGDPLKQYLLETIEQLKKNLKILTDGKSRKKYSINAPKLY